MTAKYFDIKVDPAIQPGTILITVGGEVVGILTNISSKPTQDEPISAEEALKRAIIAALKGEI